MGKIFVSHEINSYTNSPKKCKPIEYTITREGCMECVSHKKEQDGYIRLKRKGRYIYLHRLIYELKIGEIPANKVILHSCDNPACFNIEHLSIGTNEENQLDKVMKKRQAKGEKNGRSKLTEDDIRKIRKDNRSGKVIGSEYGISDVMVYSIKNLKSWKHVI